MSFIFISYSRKDKKYKNRLVYRTRQYGFEVWDDSKIEFGERWWPTIVDAISKSGAFFVIMSNDARESPWVTKEILVAQKYNKTILPLWINGEVFEILLDIHCVDLRNTNPSNGQEPRLPKRDFYQQLEKIVPRQKRVSPSEAEVIAKERAKKQEIISHIMKTELRISPPREVDSSVYDEIARWEIYRKEGINDFYGIAMLALALESASTSRHHRQAIFHLRRACKLEPRIKNKKWMTDLYGWTEEQHKVLERILMDPSF